MDNNKIEIKYVIIFFVVLIGVFIWCLHKADIKHEIQYNQYETEVKQLKDSIKQSEKVVDSLNVIANNKEATIINNTYIYEKQNKNIGAANSTITDSLFRANLLSGYQKYGHFISK